MRAAILEVALIGLALGAGDLHFPCYDEGLDYRNQGSLTSCQKRQGRCLKANGNNPQWEKVFGSNTWDPATGEAKCLNNCLIKLSLTGKLTGCQWKGTGGNNGCYRTESPSLADSDLSNLSVCWIIDECEMGTTLAIKGDVVSPQDCQDKCEQKTKCKFWTWQDKDNGICFLKNQDAPNDAVDNGNVKFISGPVNCGNVLCNSLGDPHMRINDGLATVRFTFLDKAEFIWLHVDGPDPNNPLLIVHNRQRRDLQNKWSFSSNTAVAFKGEWTDNQKIEIYGGNNPKIYVNEILKATGMGSIRNYMANLDGAIANFVSSHNGERIVKFVFPQGDAGMTYLKVGIYNWGINLKWQMNNAQYFPANDEGLCTKATKNKPWHRQWKLTCNESMLSQQYGNNGCDNDDDEEEDDPEDDCTPATQQLAEEACHECPDQYNPEDCIFDVCQAPDPQVAIDAIPNMCDDDDDEDPDCPDGYYTPNWPTSQETMDQCVHHWCDVTYTPNNGCPICGCQPDGDCVAGNEISLGNGDGETPGALSDCHINAADDCDCRDLCEDDPNHLGYHFLDNAEGQNCCCFTTE